LAVSDDELDREFYSVAAPFARQGVEELGKPLPGVDLFSFHYDLATGEPRIQTAGFVHGLTLLRQLQSFRPAEAALEPPASFEKGEAALCLANVAWISRFQKSNHVKGRFSFCRLPGSRRVFDYRTGQERPLAGGNYVPYLGADGWVSVVPRTSARPEAALALAASLSDPKTSRDIVIEPAWGGGAFRRTHFEPDGWQAFGLLGQTEWLVDVLRGTIVHSGVQNPVLRLRIPDEREHQQALVAEVRAALTGGKDPKQALVDAARRWQEIDAPKNAKLRLREYRLSLSLSGNE
jgi:hypothetical protein